MKQAIIKFKKSKSAEYAKFFAEHGFVTNLSWYEAGDGLFTEGTVTVIGCFSEDKAALFQAQFQNEIKTKI
jgi:hypothetical protein